MQRITPCLWFKRQRPEGGEVLHLHLQELEDHHRHPLRRGRFARLRQTRGNGHDHRIQAGEPRLPRAERRPALHLLAGHLTRREPQDATRDRRSVEQARRGRQDRPQCGWLQDKFGASWQIVPADIGKLVQDSRDGKADRVMQAILGMKKIDVATLKRAAR
jgi:hypothetical protein